MDTGASEFADFVAARGAALQRTGWLLTGDWAMAQDLVQTALARVWPRWERITRRDDPEIYVRRVMMNTWATWRRRHWVREHASTDVLESPAPGDVETEVALRLAVHQLLTGLTDRHGKYVLIDAGPYRGPDNGWIDHGKLINLKPADGYLGRFRQVTQEVW